MSGLVIAGLLAVIAAPSTPALLAALLVGVLAAMLTGRGEPPVEPRLRWLDPPQPPSTSRGRQLRRHRALGLVLGLGIAGLLGPTAGLLAVPTCVVGLPPLLGRLEPAGVRRRRQQIVAEMPFAIDLLAACLRAGGPPEEAVASVAAAVGGPLEGLLAEVGHRLRLGGNPVQAWSVLATEPCCAAPARAIVRALIAGAGLTRTLEGLAADSRDQLRWQAEERARAAETRAVLPLTLCFLPAFLLVGVVPAIAGTVIGLLGTLR